MNRSVTWQAIIVRTAFRLGAGLLSLLVASMLAAPVSAATCGIVVPIAGQASDINATGTLNIGSTAIDSSAGLIYAQIPEGTAQSTAAPPTNPTTPPAPQAPLVAPPILQIVDADNLAVRQKIQLPENLYSVSDWTARDFACGSPRFHHHISQAAHHSPARRESERLVERLGPHG